MVYIGPDGPVTKLGTIYIEAPVLGVVEAFHPEWLSMGLVAGRLVAARNPGLGRKHGDARGVPPRHARGETGRSPAGWASSAAATRSLSRRSSLCALAVFGLAVIGDVEALAGIYAFGATLAITIATFRFFGWGGRCRTPSVPSGAPFNLKIGSVDRPSAP